MKLIQCDASHTGLDFCLLQEGNPVALRSRSLTQAEKNYSQIEKELLAICFTTEKFDKYVYGQKVDVLSYHQPMDTSQKANTQS